MIRELKVYCATCDSCNISHQKFGGLRSILKALLVRDGWEVTEDHVTCPDCIARGVKR